MTVAVAIPKVETPTEEKAGASSAEKEVTRLETAHEEIGETEATEGAAIDLTPDHGVPWTDTMIGAVEEA